MISTLGMYRPRRTPMHAAPAWLKVIMLIAGAVAAVMLDDPVTSVGLMCASLLLLASTEPRAKPTLTALAGILVVAVASSSLHLWRGDWERAVDIAADLVTVVALALAVTCSTSMGAMLDFVAQVARPIRFLLPPETLGLMFALMLRALPEVAQIFVESRQAARARGLNRSMRAVLYPTTTRTVGFSLALGQALHARGIAEENRTSKKMRREAEEVRKRRERRSRRSRKEAVTR